MRLVAFSKNLSLKLLISVAFVAITTLMTNSAWSLGVGQIEVQSYLHQPLKARIPLHHKNVLELESILVTVASSTSFEASSNFNPAHDILTNVSLAHDGRYYIFLRSRRSIVEPILSFSVMVSLPRQRISREFSLLIDPSSSWQLKPHVTRERESNLKQLIHEPALMSQNNKNDTSEQPETPLPKLPTNNDRVIQYGPIKKNESLWKVANALKVQLEMKHSEIMSTIFSQNPQAFINRDPNLIKLGSTITVDLGQQQTVLAKPSSQEGTVTIAETLQLSAPRLDDKISLGNVYSDNASLIQHIESFESISEQLSKDNAILLKSIEVAEKKLSALQEKLELKQEKINELTRSILSPTPRKSNADIADNKPKISNNAQPENTTSISSTSANTIKYSWLLIFAFVLLAIFTSVYARITFARRHQEENENDANNPQANSDALAGQYHEIRKEIAETEQFLDNARSQLQSFKIQSKKDADIYKLYSQLLNTITNINEFRKSSDEEIKDASDPIDDEFMKNLEDAFDILNEKKKKSSIKQVS